MSMLGKQSKNCFNFSSGETESLSKLAGVIEGMCVSLDQNSELFILFILRLFLVFNEVVCSSLQQLLMPCI